MDRLRLQARGVAEPFRRPPGRRAQQAFDFLGAENQQQGIDEGRLPDAGAAGDDQHAALARLFDRLLLARREFRPRFFLAPLDGLPDVDGRVGGRHAAHRVDLCGDPNFRGAQRRQKNQRVFSDLLFDQFPIHKQPIQSFTDERLVNQQEPLRRIEQHFLGKRAVTGIRGLQQAVRNSRARPDDGIPGDANFLRDLIRGLEPDAADVLGERVGIGAHGLNGLLPVRFEDADRAAGADTVGVQEDHDLPNRPLLLPCLLDAPPAFGTDAADFLQLRRGFFNHRQDLLAEFLDHLLRVHRADALDHSAAQIFLDALA